MGLLLLEGKIAAVRLGVRASFVKSILWMI
jgi:hypothetical protein